MHFLCVIGGLLPEFRPRTDQVFDETGRGSKLVCMRAALRVGGAPSPCFQFSRVERACRCASAESYSGLGASEKGYVAWVRASAGARRGAERPERRARGSRAQRQDSERRA